MQIFKHHLPHLIHLRHFNIIFFILDHLIFLDKVRPVILPLKLFRYADLIIHLNINFRIRENIAAIEADSDPVRSTINTVLWSLETAKTMLSGRQLKDFCRLSEEEFPVILEKLEV